MNNVSSLIATRLAVPVSVSVMPSTMRPWVRRLTLVVAAVALGICGAKLRNLDPVVKTDPATGCQYLQFGVFGSQAVPRLSRSGRPICHSAPAGPKRHRI